MAEPILFNRIDKLLKLQPLLEMWGLEYDLNKLRETLSGMQAIRETLSGIQAIPLDTEDRHQPSNRAMELWLKQVREAEHAAANLFSSAEHHVTKMGVMPDHNGVGLNNRNKGIHSTAFRRRMSGEIKNLILRLQLIAAQKAQLRLEQVAAPKLQLRLKQVAALTLDQVAARLAQSRFKQEQVAAQEAQLNLAARNAQLNLAKRDVNSHLREVQTTSSLASTVLDTNHSHVVLDILDQHIQYSYYKGSKLEWMFLLSNLSLEILSAYLDQKSSPTRPRCAFIAMIVSFVALLICLVEFRLKATRKLRQSNGLFYQSLMDEPLESFLDNFGLLCTMVQCFTSTVQYAHFRRHQDNPLKLSFFPLLLAIYVIISNLRIRN